MENNLLSLIIFAPLAGAAINWLVGRRVRNEMFIATVACGSVAISTLVAFYLAFNSHGALRTEEPVFDHIWTWLHVGNLRADFALAMDRLSGTYALFVTFVGFLIHVFAVGYMHGEEGYYRFFAYLNLFMFAMLTLVLADNFVLMFVIGAALMLVVLVPLQQAWARLRARFAALRGATAPAATQEIA